MTRSGSAEIGPGELTCQRAAARFAVIVAFFLPALPAGAATLEVTAGTLTYTASAGVNNALTITLAGGNYVFADAAETVALGAGAIGAGWAGGGTTTVTGPVSSVTAGFQVNLAAGADVLTVAGLISVPGQVSLASGGTIVQSGPASITAGSLALLAGTGIGSSGAPLLTAVSRIEADTETGGLYVSNTAAILTVGGVSAALDGFRVHVSGDVQLTNDGTIQVTTLDELLRGPANVTVRAIGASSDVVTGNQYSFNAIRSTGSGSVSVQADRDVLMATGGGIGSVVSASGSVSVSAGRDIVVDGGSRLSVDGPGTAAGVSATAGRDVTLQATGGATGAHILHASNSPIVVATGPGGTLTVAGGSVPAGLSTSGGPITVTADLVVLADATSLAAGSGLVTLQQASPGRGIDLGTKAAGTLGLLGAELARVATTNAAGIVLGNAGASFTGGINVSAPINGNATYGNTLSLRAAGPFSASGAGALNVATLLVSDTSATGHAWSAVSGSFTQSPNAAIPFTTTVDLTLSGGTGSDTFSVTPSVATAFTINGNGPAPPTLPGDALHVDLGGVTSPSLTVASVASGFQGTFSFGNARNVRFSQVESGLASLPAITGLAPATGPAAGGTSVTISGTDLLGAMSVTFGAVAGTVTSNTPTAIVVTTPAYAAGAADVAVTTAGGTATSAGGFTFFAPASQLAFTTAPSAAGTAGKAWTQQPVVTVQDASGSTATTYSTPVTLSLASGSGALTCTTNPVTPVNGVATFAGCQVDAPGTVTLKATSGSIPNTTTNPTIVIASSAKSDIPTLGTTGMLGLGLLLGLAGALALRKMG